jgi:hypothetical protein
LDDLQTKLNFEDWSDYSQFSTKKVSKLWNHRQRYCVTLVKNLKSICASVFFTGTRSYCLAILWTWSSLGNPLHICASL